VEVPYIRLADGRAPADRAHLRRGPLRRRLVRPVVDDDVGALPSHLDRDPATDTARRAGDQRDLPVEGSHGHRALRLLLLLLELLPHLFGGLLHFFSLLLHPRAERIDLRPDATRGDCAEEREEQERRADATEHGPGLLLADLVHRDHRDDEDVELVSLDEDWKV